MNGPFTPEGLMAKAFQACRSAEALLQLGDADGACNRAYYAMFDAARAVLLSKGQSAGKTHRGVINAFSLNLVKDGPLSKELLLLLKNAEETRYAADYANDSVERGDAQRIVEEARVFVEALAPLIAAGGT